VADAVNGVRKVAILCSGGAAQHKPWRLGFILEVGDRSPVGAGCSMIRNADGVGTGYLLRCGEAKCRQSKPITFRHWRKLVAGWDEANRDTLDIAALPF
jgi:hypothetical protein